MPYGPLLESAAEAAFTTSAGEPLTSVGETLSSLREELLLQLASRDDVDSTRLDRWINWGYRNVTSMFSLKELEGSATFDLVVDQNLYLLPQQVAYINMLSRVDPETYSRYGGRELEKIDKAMYRTLPDEEGKPQRYFRLRRMLVLWPVPEEVQAMSIDFKVRPDDLVDDTDSPILPTEFHEAILLSARHRAWRSLLDYKQAQQAMNDFLVCIRPLQNTDAEEAPSTTARLSPARTEADLYRSRR